MARRKRRFDAQSILKYIAKTEKLYRANTKDEVIAKAQADIALYNWIAGQGGYVGVREQVSEILDELEIPNAVRLPFFAIAQKIAKFIVSDEIKTEADFDKIFDALVRKHFVEGSELYNIATGKFREKLKAALLTGTYVPEAYRAPTPPTD